MMLGTLVGGDVVLSAVVPVLPNPPFARIVWSRVRRSWKAGVAAFSKMSWAILSPSSMSNFF